MTRPDDGPRHGSHRIDGGERGIDTERPGLAGPGLAREPPRTDGAPPSHTQRNEPPHLETGTTIVAVAATDGVVMAADQRMSLGGRFTANKNVRKVEQVHPTAAMAISGSVGPAQGLLQSLRAETRLYESRRGDPMSMQALSQTAGHLVRGLPVAPILAGVDHAGGRVFELDGSGSVLEDDYTAGGSGMQVAYGVLERRVEADGAAGTDGGPDRSVEDATAAATAAVAAASERDTASGDGVTVATITDDGVDVADESETYDLVEGDEDDDQSASEVA